MKQRNISVSCIDMDYKTANTIARSVSGMVMKNPLSLPGTMPVRTGCHR